MQKSPKEIASLAKQYKAEGKTWEQVCERLNGEGYKTMSNGAYTPAYIAVVVSKYGKSSGAKARKKVATKVTAMPTTSFTSVKAILKTFPLSPEEKKNLAIYLLTA